MYKQYLKKIDTDSLRKKAVKAHGKSFLQEKPFKYILMAVGLLLAIDLVFILTHLKVDQTSQPIKYNYLFGITKTGSWISTLILPAILIIVTLTNVLAAEYFYKKDKLLTYIFLSINLFLTIIVFLETIALNARGS